MNTEAVLLQLDHLLDQIIGGVLVAVNNSVQDWQSILISTRRISEKADYQVEIESTCRGQKNYHTLPLETHATIRTFWETNNLLEQPCNRLTVFIDQEGDCDINFHYD